LGLDKQCPFPRQVSSIGRIIEIRQPAVFITVTNALQRKNMAMDECFGE
jgi:hypothetical protein